MAWITIQKPGTKYGPCKTECKHHDCNASREMASKICPGCAEALGYEQRISEFSDALTEEFQESKLWHRDCLETWIEQQEELARQAASR